MRNVILGMNVTLDGYVAGPHGELDWLLPNMTPAQIEMEIESLREADTMILGRVNYLDQAAHWPTQTTELATLLNNHTKIVFSKTLNPPLEWHNSRLARADVAEEIAHLKAQPGKNIIVTGGPTLAQSFLRLDLIDEIHLIVHPLVLGCGIPLFKDQPLSLHLSLRHMRTFETGAVSLLYQKVVKRDVP